VGTGFHPELSGRENVFLNGALLGMSRREIAKKFDEIVAFSEIERFIDTPVKRYSSGMYVRLAFAVAAHLEPEILIVDEVLAVGDASFQKMRGEDGGCWTRGQDDSVRKPQPGCDKGLVRKGGRPSKRRTPF
jgi:lipopolysaccharide transport system ATP-binding protein